MTKIDFYILKLDTVTAAMHYACRLAEKAYRSGHDVYLHCDDSDTAASGQGVEHWPTVGRNRTLLVDDKRLPFAAGSSMLSALLA